MGGRKKPFSGKLKKQQLQAKRERQQSKESGNNGEGEGESSPIFVSSAKPAKEFQVLPTRATTSNDTRTQHKNEFTTASFEEAASLGSKFFEVKQPTSKADAGRYALIFRKETKDELAKQKKEGRITIHPVLEEYLECKIEDFFTPELDFPIRPPWNYDVTREDLERNEHRYFRDYLKKIDEKFKRKDLSYFELNLETWRQLWRVLEMSDIVLCVVDIRYPPLLFPPKLYNYVCTELGKHLILVLNKIDMCPATLVLAWKAYFQQKYPELKVMCFTSYPAYNLYGSESSGGMKGRKRRGRMKMAAEGAFELYKICEDIVQGEVDTASWKAKILEEMETAIGPEEDVKVQVDKTVTEKPDTGFYDFKKYHGGTLTIGCIGQPNVGKSSLINALMGKKVVSVSKTPGHTKHFQTIFLTPNVRLCDCPGLIFPSKIPKSLQVLCGSYPIAQLREPYSTIKYLAERLDLPKILRITHPEGESEWCACDIADGWAVKRGYYTAKAARLDTYRGANHILRLALDGRICLCLYPPNYSNCKEEWGIDPRIAEIQRIQAQSNAAPLPIDEIVDSSDDENYYHMHKRQEKCGSNLEKDEASVSDTETQQTTSGSTKAKNTGFAVKNKFAMLLEDEGSDDSDA
ncbi:Guanine nucleotide-binding protein-like 1 [Orchesella cincta]|uniref:Guanine nucleotide-binding protein-like 1 n=1 Tax=Orchesella cincta TaxID=48709 RepID=A0A1D2NKI4_ORCCI|nr:Guanine nucleotide-binding protein-like 1 [Orchesella cincta]